jgi:large subunit ribosomal protein L1
MAKKRSKRYRQAAEMIEEGKSYSLSDAVDILKKFPPAKFDETSDQMVRGTCPLPHGSGKEVRVMVFAQGEAANAAKNAGAEYVGYDDMLKKVQDGFQDFDVAVATPEAMAEVRKLGRFLGPRGLMPNPKTGTVTDDTATAVNAVKAGRIDFRLDRNGNISAPIGRMSFSPEQLLDNGQAVMDAVVRARPASAKGRYLDSVTLSSTVSPGLPLEGALFEKKK